MRPGAAGGTGRVRPGVAVSAPAAPPLLRLLIVDDEPLARLRLRALVESLPEAGAEVVDEASDAVDAAPRIERGGIDAVLLDIRMPGPNPAQAGLRLAALIRGLPQPPAVVFVTAYAEHALAAFDLDAVDYLTKPVRRERLLDALLRVRQRRQPPADGAAAVPPETPVLVVADRGRLLRVPHDEVLYLKAEQKYLTLRTADRSHIVDGALADFETRLGSAFIRVHRNALVAKRAIRALEVRDAADDEADAPGDAGAATTAATGAHAGWAVRVAPLDEWLAVSRRQVAAVREALRDARR